MRISRRDLLRTGAVIATGAAVEAVARQSGAAATGAATQASTAASTPPTTLQQTLLRPLNASGYVRLHAGPGEPHLVRTDIGGTAHPGRQNRRAALVGFGHLTDLHVVDAQSPARVEFLDRYNDTVPQGPFAAAYRPHEMLTAQVANTMIATVRRLHTAPVTGRPLTFTISTGDAVDNCQHNELRWVIDLLDGGRSVRPDSGDRTRWEGVADDNPQYYDTHYWHPHRPPPGKPADDAKTKYGFPQVPGLLPAARRAFTSTGIGMPWYAAYGNHDGLIQGNAPVNGALGAVATGSLKAVGLTPGTDPNAVAAALLAGKPLPEGVIVRPVSPDPDRRVITRKETIAEHFNTRSTPVGHGFTANNRSTGTAYYRFDPTPCVRGIVLDTVNPGGYSDGSLDTAQFAWLGQQLNTAGSRLVVIFSHHTIATMDNPTLAPGETGPRVLGQQVRDLLLSHPRVVLWVNGHTHVNTITPHARPAGGTPGGFWEVNTASHIDWPQQSRIVELVDNHDGTLSIFGTILDFAGPAVQYSGLDRPDQLASLSRELAANDWQERTGHSATVDGRRGSAADRNVELIVPDPR